MKNLFIAMLLLVTLSLGACKKNYEEGGYEAPKTLVISGPAEVKKNNSVDFATYYINGTYVWEVTGDATISGGQGTSKVTIKFGNTNAKVTVTVADKSLSRDITVQ
ncbi:hypothetical protein DBR43_05215 [Pedobacter sp. KBW06]|uniref:hypothetical protein n=1 Tax=Pedobacter sp. KBW06 TaxID=2153359 RepID=UPI000F59377A|nr:hypothetical protein [Pedobacter sp. KBW06]RQO74786.1 hypothetical protein DBR43_05215 [Pedobacter sp. KBW06]